MKATLEMYDKLKKKNQKQTYQHMYHKESYLTLYSFTKALGVWAEQWKC